MSIVQGIDPRTGTAVGPGIQATTADELEGVLARAQAAFDAFSRSEPGVRIALLTGLADALDARTAELADLAALESGLPPARVTGEVGRTSGQLRLFADVVADGAYLEVVLDSADAGLARPDLRRWLEPVGPVLMFAASNFPLAFSVLGGDTASALACGAPVVVKAHGSHPTLSATVAKMAAGVVSGLGLDPGVIGIVFGDENGVTALKDSRIKACGFTGSTSGGRFLVDIASARPEPIPFFGELGSINPAVVTPAAVVTRGGEIAADFVTSFTLGTGQFCTKPGLLFLPAGHGLEQALADLVGAIDAAPMLNRRMRDQLAELTEQTASVPGVRTLAAGRPAPTDGAWTRPQLFTITTAEALAEPQLLTREQFGPVAVVVTYDDSDQLLAALRAVGGALTATVHAQNDDSFPVAELLTVLRRLVGRVIFNGWPTGVAVTWSMNHGGPWPSTTNAAHTSVGATAARRWQRPICYQSVPAALLPSGVTRTLGGCRVAWTGYQQNPHTPSCEFVGGSWCGNALRKAEGSDSSRV